MQDHLHIVSDLHPSMSLAVFIKVASCLWMKESGKFPGFTNWQEVYGAFTFSAKKKEPLWRM